MKRTWLEERIYSHRHDSKICDGRSWFPKYAIKMRRAWLISESLYWRKTLPYIYDRKSLRIHTTRICWSTPEQRYIRRFTKLCNPSALWMGKILTLYSNHKIYRHRNAKLLFTRREDIALLSIGGFNPYEVIIEIIKLGNSFFPSPRLDEREGEVGGLFTRGKSVICIVYKYV